MLVVETDAVTDAPKPAASQNTFDLIVIGSGMGGLAFSSLAAQLNRKRVLLIERHFKLGGFTHSFQRKAFHWDVGLHYVGAMHDGGQTRVIFDLVTAGAVKWEKIPDPFDVFVYPGLNFKMSSGVQNFERDLVAQFPEERRAIKQYLRDIERAGTAFVLQVLKRHKTPLTRLLASGLSWAIPPKWNVSTKDYLERRFSNPQLRALVASQWGDYGLPPAMSPFCLHSLVASHFIDGGYYPVGGAQRIGDSVRPLVEAAGGQVLVGQEVETILCENGKATGVRTRGTEGRGRNTYRDFFAPAIVSNAGTASTFLKLLPKEAQPAGLRDSVAAFAKQSEPSTCVTLYIGFKRDPRELGFKGENHWIFSDIDHDASFAHSKQWRGEGEPPWGYLSFPSLKDPLAKSHTAEIISMVSYDAFAKWRDQPWKNRDADYEASKDRYADALISFVDRHYPGFADAIAYSELSTPVSTEHFTGHQGGGMYGLSSVKERFAPENAAWTHPQTPVKGLYLTGSDVGSLGIAGAIMGALATLSHIPGGASLRRVFTEAYRLQKTQRQKEAASDV